MPSANRKQGPVRLLLMLAATTDSLIGHWARLGRSRTYWKIRANLFFHVLTIPQGKAECRPTARGHILFFIGFAFSQRMYTGEARRIRWCSAILQLYIRSTWYLRNIPVDLAYAPTSFLSTSSDIDLGLSIGRPARGRKKYQIHGNSQRAQERIVVFSMGLTVCSIPD